MQNIIHICVQCHSSQGKYIDLWKPPAKLSASDKGNRDQKQTLEAMFPVI